MGSITFGRIDDVTTVATTVKGIGPPPNGNPIALVTLNDDTRGGWAREYDSDRAGTLLHELGHAYNAIYGAGSSRIRPDGQNSDPANQALNNDDIDKKCLH